MTTANTKRHCGQSISLSRPGEVNRTAYCMEPVKHVPPCKAEAVLGTFEGEVKATIRWFPAEVRRTKDSRGTKANAMEMVKGRHYKIGPYRDSEVVELSQINYETGLVIVHPPGNPDMQSCFGVRPDLQVFEVQQPQEGRKA